MLIGWRDTENTPGTLTRYMYVILANKKCYIVDLREFTDCSGSNGEYRHSIPVNPWCTYHIEVYAMNDCGRSAPRYVVVQTNQRKPSVKPSDIKVNSLSNSSVRLTVLSPPGKPDGMEITHCKVHIFKAGDTCMYSTEWEHIQTEFQSGEILVHIREL